VGNPGTGKTTVARIMGNIFYSLGLLPSNKVVEVTPKDLIAPYVGQTGPKTAQMIDRALGGILFIDEAYGLNDGQMGGGFGKDAMNVLLTKLLDYKGRLVCIAAGYPREIQQWLDTNSGASSRFTREIVFDDYSAEELATIFRNIATKNKMNLDPEADEEMLRYFTKKVNNKSKNFANAREARNYYDRVKLNQGRRLKKCGNQIDRDELFMLRKEDMEIND
jgi:SpoVK/Ycf46/Vps4 family AAA+-type ATPase